MSVEPEKPKWVNYGLTEIDPPESIVWLEDPRPFPYLRALVISKGSRRPPTESWCRKNIGEFWRLFGYGPAYRYAPGCFQRVIYYLKRHDAVGPDDAGTYAKGFGPCEGVPVRILLRGIEPKIQPLESVTHKKKVVPRCPACGKPLVYRRSVKAFVCKNWKCLNFWKYGRGPVLARGEG
jgi:ribosomal protein L37AE/L43A